MIRDKRTLSDLCRRRGDDTLAAMTAEHDVKLVMIMEKAGKVRKAQMPSIEIKTYICRYQLLLKTIQN